MSDQHWIEGFWVGVVLALICWPSVRLLVLATCAYAYRIVFKKGKEEAR